MMWDRMSCTWQIEGSIGCVDLDVGEVHSQENVGSVDDTMVVVEDDMCDGSGGILWSMSR